MLELNTTFIIIGICLLRLFSISVLSGCKQLSTVFQINCPGNMFQILILWAECHKGLQLFFSPLKKLQPKIAES